MQQRCGNVGTGPSRPNDVRISHVVFTTGANGEAARGPKTAEPVNRIAVDDDRRRNITRHGRRGVPIEFAGGRVERPHFLGHVDHQFVAAGGFDDARRAIGQFQHVRFLTPNLFAGLFVQRDD